MAKRHGWTYEQISDMTLPQIQAELTGGGRGLSGGYHPNFPGQRVAICDTWEEVYKLQNQIRRK